MTVLAKQKTIDEIVKYAKKLDEEELQILLYRLRIKKLLKDGIKPVANPPKGIRMPTMKQINKWKHEARNYKAEKKDAD